MLCALFCAVTAFAFAGCKKTEAAKKYAVIFMDGETQISEQTVEANKEAVKPADPTKESTVGEVYTFAGWSLTENGETVTDFTIKADTTFYAVYTPATRQYKVTFMNGAEKLSENDVDYNGVAAAPTQTPAKESTVDTVYTFAGWALTDGGEKVDELKITGDTTFYAVYTPATRQYKVTFMNGTEKLSENDVDYNGVAAAPTQTPAKESTVDTVFAFAGWSLTENGETVTDFTIKADTTFYAVYTPATRQYKVTFMNGTEKLSENDVDYNTTAAAPATNPSKPSDAGNDYTFAGWSLTENGETVTDFTIKADTTFYAVYTSVTRQYKVTFMNGSEKLSESDVDYNGVAAAPTQTPAKESTVDTVYTFAGWSLTDGGEKVDELKITGDTTFYAVYTSATRQYKVTFMNGSDKLSESDVDYNGVAVAPTQTPAKESTVDTVYAFAGWSLTDGGEKVDELKITGDTTFYAVYTPSVRKYNVQFIGDDVDVTVSVNARETVPALKDEEGALGRKIVGYYSDEGFGTEFDTEAEILKDTVVYVKLSDYVYFNGAMLKQFAPLAGASTTLNADETLTMTGVKGSFIYKKALNLAMNDTNGIEIKLKLNGVSRVDIYAFGAYVLDGQGGSNDNYGQQYTQFRGLSANGWSVVQDGEYAIMTYDLSYAGGTSSLNFAYTVINGFRIDIMEINTSAENPTITVDYVKSIKIEKSYNVNYYVNGAVKKTATVKEGEKAIALKDEEGALGRQIAGYYTDAAFTQVFDIANTAITQDTNVYVKLSDYVYFNGVMMSKFTGGNATKTLNADGTLTLLGADKDKYIHQKGLNLSVEGANRVEIRAKQNGVYRLDLYLFGNYTLDGNVATGTDYDADKGGFRYRGVDASYGYSVVKDGEYVIMTYDLSYANGNTAKNLVFNVINGFRIDIVGVNASVENSSIAIDYVKIIKK